MKNYSKDVHDKKNFQIDFFLGNLPATPFSCSSLNEHFSEQMYLPSFAVNISNLPVAYPELF